MAIQSESSVQQHTYSAIGHQILSLRSGLSSTEQHSRERCFYAKGSLLTEWWQCYQFITHKAYCPRGCRDAMVPPNIGRSVKPISNRWADYAHQIIMAPPDFWHFLWPCSDSRFDFFLRRMLIRYQKLKTAKHEVFETKVGDEWEWLSNRQIDSEDFVNFCGLLRKREL